MMRLYMTVVPKYLLLNVFLNVPFIGSRQAFEALKENAKYPQRQVHESMKIDRNSRKHLTSQIKDDFHDTSMTTVIINWTSGQNLSHSNQANISTGSQENYPNEIPFPSTYAKQSNSTTEVSSIRSFISSSNISEVMPYQIETDIIINSTNYNLTKKSQEEKNTSNIIIENKAIEEIGQTIKPFFGIFLRHIWRIIRHQQLLISDVALLWIILSSIAIIIIAQILFCFLTCGHCIFQLKED